MEVVAVTLDVTGTLIHSPRLGEIYTEVLARHGLDVNARTVGPIIQQVWGEFDCQVSLGEERFGSDLASNSDWWRRFMERVCEHLGQPSPGRFAAAELFDRFARADAWEVYPDVMPALEALSARLRLVVLSNWDLRLPRLLQRLDLTPFFESIVFSAEVGVEKPHPGIFQAALEGLAVAPEMVVHVGDRQRDDVEGATAIGMHALLLDRKGERGDLKELTELAALLVGQ